MAMNASDTARARCDTTTCSAHKLGFSGCKELRPVLEEFWGPDNPNFRLARRSDNYLSRIADRFLSDRGHMLWPTHTTSLNYPNDAAKIKSQLISILHGERRNQKDQRSKKRNRDCDSSMAEDTSEPDDNGASVHSRSSMSVTPSFAGPSSSSYQLRSHGRESSNFSTDQKHLPKSSSIAFQAERPHDNEPDQLSPARDPTRQLAFEHHGGSWRPSSRDTSSAEPQAKRVRLPKSSKEGETAVLSLRQKRSPSPRIKYLAERRVRSTPYGGPQRVNRSRSPSAQKHEIHAVDATSDEESPMNMSEQRSKNQSTQATLTPCQSVYGHGGTQTAVSAQPNLVEKGRQTVFTDQLVTADKGCQTIRRWCYQIYDRKYSISEEELYHSMKLLMTLCVEKADQGFAQSRNAPTAEGRAVGKVLIAAFTDILETVDADLLQRGAKLKML